MTIFYSVFAKRVRLMCMMHGLLAAMIFVLSGCGEIGSDRREQKVFLQAFETAHLNRDVDAMLALYALDGVADDTRGVLRFSVATEIGWPVLRVRFIGLDPSEVYVYEVNGELFGPSLKPVERIHVEYDLPQRVNSTFLVGRDADGHFRLVAPKRVKN